MAAKQKRRDIGAVYKGKDGNPDYIKIDQDVTLRSGQFLNLESKASRIAGLEKARQDGKLTDELVDKLLGFAEKIPEFVRFKVVLVEKQE